MNQATSQTNLMLAASYPLDQLHVERGGVLVAGAANKDKSKCMVEVIATVAKDLMAVKGSIFAPPPSVTKKLYNQLASQYDGVKKVGDTKPAELLRDVFKVTHGGNSALEDAMKGFRESYLQYNSGER